MKAIVP